MQESTILHISTVHPRTDTRIFVKELRSLRTLKNVQLGLIVQDGLEAEIKDGIGIFSAGPKLKRQRNRISTGIWRMLAKVRSLRPSVVHFHDPELIPIGLVLKAMGAKIIYDVHEDVPKQLHHSGKIPKNLVRPVSAGYILFETLARWFFDACIIVVPAQAERFKGKKTILLANFPSLAEFPAIGPDTRSPVSGQFVYAGGITETRGINEMVCAISMLPSQHARLRLLGSFNSKVLEEHVRRSPGWNRVEFLGWGDRSSVTRELSQACAGLVLLHPTPQYVISYPVKMFEYMAAGLPVIASDFPLWRQIVDGAGCGLLVDPKDPQAIADAMQWMIDHPSEAVEMGRRGRKAVEEHYNWEAESVKLVSLYRKLLAET